MRHDYEWWTSNHRLSKQAWCRLHWGWHRARASDHRARCHSISHGARVLFLDKIVAWKRFDVYTSALPAPGADIAAQCAVPTRAIISGDHRSASDGEIPVADLRLYDAPKEESANLFGRRHLAMQFSR